jgi:hypothetical protein
VLSEQAYLQQRLDLAGRGIRLRGGAPDHMMLDAWSARGEVDSSSAEPSEAQRSAA